MKLLTDLLQSENVEELEAEIQTRVHARARMVGQLYPGILTNEITQLRNRIEELRRKKKDSKLDI